LVRILRIRWDFGPLIKSQTHKAAKDTHRRNVAAAAVECCEYRRAGQDIEIQTVGRSTLPRSGMPAPEDGASRHTAKPLAWAVSTGRRYVDRAVDQHGQVIADTPT